MALKIRIKKKGDITIIKIDGRVIGVDSKKFNKKMESLVKKKEKKIVIDISDIEFIDSYGLGAIVYYHTFMQNSGRELLFYNKPSNHQTYLARLLDLTKLNQVFKVIDSYTDLLSQSNR